MGLSSDEDQRGNFEHSSDQDHTAMCHRVSMSGEPVDSGGWGTYVSTMVLGVTASMLLVWIIGSTPVLAGGLAVMPTREPILSCEALAKTNLTGAVDTPARVLSTVRIDSRVGPFCRVIGLIEPAIHFELDLPINGWQQRYLQTGCGGLCGRLNVEVSHAGSCEPALQGGLAIGSDDMGHQSRRGPPEGNDDGVFGGDPQKRIDFAYRANHVTALVSKALIKTFYGKEPRYSYFSGCSDGGREALVEAERFPEDFNGIAAGAPAMNFQVQNSFYHAWQYRSNTGPDGRHILLADRLPILHRAALAACDSEDGLRDGLIADPRACHFDPAAGQCAANATNTQDCLTAAEVAAARKLYEGPRDAAGHRFTIGGPQPGSELSWAGVYVPTSAEGQIMSQGAAGASSQYLIFPEASTAEGDIVQFDFSREHFARLDALHSLYDATDPDLAAFQKGGGKLILWHGWSDPHISPINTIAFHHAVGRQLGDKQRDSFVRLFLFPGMYHCGGGDGFSQFDILTPLMAWVEGHSAPEKIVAAQVPDRPRGPLDRPGTPRGAPPVGPPPGTMAPPEPGGGPAPLPEEDAEARRTRPVYPYPWVAKYSGQGSPDDAANFVPVQDPFPDPTDYPWEGQHFYSADSLKQYQVRDGKLVAVGSQ